MSEQYNLAAWYVYALTGSVDTVMDWRCIHDQRKDLPAHNYRGSLNECWHTLQSYNAQGYGIFATFNALDGVGRELPNVAYIRAHVLDLDSPTAPADYERAVAAGASFAVQSSPNKFHVYFRVQPYVGNDFFTLQQRRLNQVYNGDQKVIDATRVMRVPGFLHQKGAPIYVTGWQLPAFDHVPTAEAFGATLAHVNVIDHVSARQPLGTPEMAAPSLDWLKFALSLVNPNDLDRSEWLSISAAFKQAGWSHADPDTLLKIWLDWCAQYQHDESGENMKLWNSVNDTETGWSTFERRTVVSAYMKFGEAPTPQKQQPAAQAPAMPQQQIQTPPMATGGTPEMPAQDEHEYREILNEYECREWFKDCYFVEQSGKIFTPGGRFMNSTQFNGCYGGKVFIVTGNGKITDEPWKAALRSTCWTIPKVDHIRFLPSRPRGEIIVDTLGRRGLNTYLAAKIDSRPGDVSMWLDWFDKTMPNKNDQNIFLGYLAHCVKYPGHKIPWSPMLQSMEGIGKTLIMEVMTHALGDMYIYTPNANEMVKSGTKFNAWMRSKLLIMVNEIKVDERRELIEILKPMITDARVEVQGKGVDQDMEDNVANWLFFSNFRDAIPISQNGRRYAIFYSALQNKADMIAAGMDDAYFNRLWTWLRKEGGIQAIAHWLLNYPIECGALPVRAPETSSHAEALALSRSPVEVTIAECVSDDTPGFRGGYVSTVAALAKAKAAGIRSASSRTIAGCLETLGYVRLGRATRSYFQEGPDARADIWGVRSDMPVDGYGRAQGYE